MSQQLMNLVEKPYLKDSPPEFHVGDTVDVQCRIVEGEKERIQIFNGIVIAHQGRGINETSPSAGSSATKAWSESFWSIRRAWWM